MKATWQKRFLKLRAACVLLAIALGWIAASVDLILPSPNVCSMACCVTEGHCCCTPHLPFVKGQSEDGRDKIAATSLLPSCPEGCVTPQAATFLNLRDGDHTASYALDISCSAADRTDRFIITSDSVWSRPSSPRAPPRFPANLIA